ncbi:MAG: HAD family hydrolase [Amphiplicatus sp.]
MANKNLTTVAFDADDTLWQNERFFRLTEARFAALLADYAEPEDLTARLLAAEKRNLSHYGFGIKGFTLSMIETAIEITEGRVPASVLSEILGAGREMLAHPVELLPGVEETLGRLADSHRLVLITKGDLFDQERKLAASGLGELFAAVEIVSDKSPSTYRTAFEKHGDGTEKSMMVGNSLKSDIIPAIEVGSWGVYVPHALTWSVEYADAPADAPRFREVDVVTKVATLIEEIG